MGRGRGPSKSYQLLNFKCVYPHHVTEDGQKNLEPQACRRIVYEPWAEAGGGRQDGQNYWYPRPQQSQHSPHQVVFWKKCARLGKTLKRGQGWVDGYTGCWITELRWFGRVWDTVMVNWQVELWPGFFFSRPVRWNRRPPVAVYRTGLTDYRLKPIKFKIKFKIACVTGSERYTDRFDQFTSPVWLVTGRFEW